ARVYQRKNTIEKIDMPIACVTDFDVMPDCAPKILAKVDSDDNWPEKSNRRWRATKDFSTEELSKRRDDIYEKASGQNVKTFVADEWTFEYDLAFSGLPECVWIAANLAKFDEQISAGKKTVYSIARMAQKDYKVLSGQHSAKEELASHIYKLFEAGSKVSKATSAQYLASVLKSRIKSGRLSSQDLLERL